MNRNCYRLVFNTTLGMMVPVAESARRHGKAASASALALAGVLLAGAVRAELPVPSAGGAIPAFVGAGAASYATSGMVGQVTQTTPKAILNWQSYNVGAGNTLTYRFQDGAGNLPAGASFSTLNRIWQGSPSEIAGRIQVQPGQNGQITLINQNGILFRDGAQISVGSLVASSLDIRDDLFLAGIVSNTLAFEVPAYTAFEGASGGLVRVDAGAELKTDKGGRVMLLAENVENHGVINTPEGQTILAAGNKVYLAVSDDPRLRGFLVEVDNGGTAANTGRILAERGNVSMTGLMVNQSGRVSATTSVNLNGSIRLMARDTVSAFTPPPVGTVEQARIPLGERTGTLVFGSGSVTEVTPDALDTSTVTDQQGFNRSRIEGVGRTVHLRGGSQLRAQGGEIALSAQAGQVFQLPGASRADGVRIQVDAGALLDVSGLRDVPVSVERNYIQVELRGDQLKDAPLQRDSFLRNSKVWIDIERGTPLADVSGYIAQVGRTVTEKSATGGDIGLKSEGDLLLQTGALLDVSGGSLAYQAGFGRTTTLVQNGKIVDIGAADPNQVYDGFANQYTVKNIKWGVTETYDLSKNERINSYTQGRDAGTVSLTAHNLVADATLRGHAVNGDKQRGNPARGGRLTVNDLSAPSAAAFVLPDVRFTNALPARSVAMGDTLPEETLLSIDFLRQGGFSGVAVYSDGRIELPRDVALNTGNKGSVTLQGRQLEIDGDIFAPGGSIALSTRASTSAASDDANDHGLRVGADALLSVRGLWINDMPDAGGDGRSATTIHGGAITLSSVADLDLQAGSVLDVSGGAWAQADGRIRSGNAGSISLASGRFGLNAADVAQTSRIRLNGELRAYAPGNGGKLTMNASSVYLGSGGSGKPGELVLDEAFFTSGGFKDYDLGGADGVTLADGFQLKPQPWTQVLDSRYRLQASGAGLGGFSTQRRLNADLRQPTSIVLRATNTFNGALKVGEGARIEVDPQGSVALSAQQQLTVLGTVSARAGSISLSQPIPLPIPEGPESFDASRTIWLGANSRLDASGYYRATYDANGLRAGKVLDGGNVSINAAKGYLVMQPGSLIDVSGARATLDLRSPGGWQATDVGSRGGDIRLSAREGVLLEGSLKAHGGNSQVPGGSLAMRLHRDQKPWNNDPASPVQSQRVITLQAAPTALSAGLNPGDALDAASLNGRAGVAQDQVRAGGFSNLALESENRIAFSGDLDLAIDGRLALYAPNLSAAGATTRVKLGAASIIMGNRDRRQQDDGTRNDASGGSAALKLESGLIELVGHASLQGFGRTELASSGDIRVRSVVYETRASDGGLAFANSGSLVSGGDLYLAARQVYPSSMAEFALEVHNNSLGRITIASSGAGNPVLSAGGKLRLAAPFIDQQGAIKAPFGEISLKSEAITRSTVNAQPNGLPLNTVTTRGPAPGGLVTLAAGSLTSVSAEGQTIPLGHTELAGRDWLYDLKDYKAVLATPPEKRIVLDGDRVNLAAGARIDLSGGGDLYAYEFQSGPGGSRDVLLAENSKDVYAVLPGLENGFAAYDAAIYKDLPDWNPGARVKLLEDANGLRAGTYALLPARYALLPGAFLVRVNQADSDLNPGLKQQLPDGTVLAAGYLGSAAASGGIAHGARTATIAVRPGSAARQSSQFLDTYASSKYAKLSGAQQVGDAGRLSISAVSSLNLAGSLLTAHGSGKRGAEVDILALKLAVTADGASYAPDHVSLSAAQLNSLGASSLLLGGVRSVDAQGDRVNVGQRSDRVVIAAGASLAAPELLLVARDTVKLENGSEVAGQGQFSGRAKDIHLADAAGSGDGALLRVATSEQVAMTRAPASRSRGVLDVAPGATVRAGQSAILDATLDNRSLGQVVLPASGGALTLGATRISLAQDGVPVAADGLVFDQTRLGQLGSPAALRLRSYSTLDLYGSVSLGGAGLGSLDIEAAGLAGFGAAGASAALQAGRVRFANPDGIAAGAAFAGATGQGKLKVQAQEIALGTGDFTLRGFDTVDLTASEQVIGQGGSFSVEAGGGAAGRLDLHAGRIAVAAGADQAIRASGALTTYKLALPATLGAPPLGGKLTLAGSSLLHGGRVAMPAGVVAMQSTDAAGALHLLDGSEILAGGATLAFADTQAHAAGGLVKLQAAGKFDMHSGALIDVAGDSAGGDAGEVRILAAGDADVAGALRGGAAGAYRSGRFQITANRINADVGGLNDYSSLNTLLQAGGFHQSRYIRARQGDIVVKATDVAKAHEFVLAADQGNLWMAGTIDASGAKGGRIELYAGRDLKLQSGAHLDASATELMATAKGSAGEGGLVVLGSGDTGRLDLAAGATIDVSTRPASAARQGKVLLRARRLGADVAVDDLKSAILGAESVSLEALRVYDNISTLAATGGSGSSLSLATINADNTAFAAHHAAIKTRLGQPALRVLSGVEVRSSGNLTLGADWNLLGSRVGGEAGMLTLRAAGNLNLNSNLSDGFSTATSAGILQSAPASWSYRVAAGADRAAADPLAVQGSTGDVSIAANKLLRTGSGSIDVAAAGDVKLGSGAAIYTAGYATPAVVDFTLPTSLRTAAAFPTGGGDLRVRAGRSVISAAGPAGLITDWLYRQGDVGIRTSISNYRSPGWWLQTAGFKDGVGALGGGDVEVAAGERVANLLAATATNARQPARFGQAVDAGRQVIQGGGALAVQADGDIEGGVFMVDRGAGRISAGGLIGDGVARGSQPVGTVLVLGDASASVSARRGLAMESVVTPGLLPQVSANETASRSSYFVTYGTDSAARLTSVAGDIRLKNDAARLTQAFDLKEAATGGLKLYPGSLDAAALQGDLVIDADMTLLPATSGALRLLAGGSVVTSGSIQQSDLAPDSLPRLPAPITSVSDLSNLGLLRLGGKDAHAPTPVHLDDAQPVYVVARKGDIVGKSSTFPFAVLPKAAVFEAGRDIRNVTVHGQNLRDTDTTRFVAGRDLVFDSERSSLGSLSSISASGLFIGGPGRVQAIAGRNVDLGVSRGIVTRGNLDNPFLPEGGASLLVIAGANATDKTGNGLPLNPAVRDEAVIGEFFGALAAAAKQPDGQYQAGLDAIGKLFPAVDANNDPLGYQGDISLFFSQIKTEQGGPIRMLAPGGQVNAGLASVTGFERAASDLGVMTVQGGDIQSYTRGDFQVNSSRVFTLSGGDILMWSNEGNIDAGKGAKTATATPPPQLRIDKNGNFVLDVSQSASGSGIGALRTGSNATLVAPKGEVNAGDAGIRAGGDLTLRANVVVGADNIQVGGASTGVPVASTGALGGAGLSGTGDVGGASATAALSQNLAEAARAAEEMKKSFKPTFISAEVIGFGD